MNKYDYYNLIQRVYTQGITKEGLTPNLLDEIRNVIEADKINVNCVFGIGYYPEYEPDVLCVFISDMKVWKEEGCCSDYSTDEVYEALTTMGFREQEDGIWATGDIGFDKEDGRTIRINQLSREKIYEKLSNLGFHYDEKFEYFMMDV